MTDWTPTDDQYDIIMAFALQNVIEYDGKPQMGSLMKRMMGPQGAPELRQYGKYMAPLVQESMADAVNLYDAEGRDASLEYLGTLGPKGLEMLDRFREMEGPKVKREQVLKELRNVEPGNFRVRFAPNPNAPLTIGHSRGVVINRAYADKYQGQFYLRLDDTGMGTKPPLAEAYDMISEDIKWLTGDYPDEVFIASDRLEVYEFWAKELIKLGGAYVDTLSRDESAELKADGLPNPYRERTIEENLELFDNMIQGDFLPGEAVLRIKSDPNAPDPAMRDFILFRIQIGGHPRRPIDTCWPLLDFQSAIDDHLLEITHIIRGEDLRPSSGKQKLLYNYFGWQYPEVEYWGRVEMLEESIDSKTGDVLRNQDGDVVYVPISFSSSAYAKGIQEGRYDNWADPRLYTVQGMKNRGYSPEAITQWWKDMGMTNRNIKAPLTTLDSLNNQYTNKNAETFEADELGDATYDSDCLICARPFGDGFGLWANRQTFEYLQDKYESATKEAANNAFSDLAKSQGLIIESLDDFVNFKNSVPDELYDNIKWTSENTLYSKTNPFGVRKTGRTLAYWWLIKIPITLYDGTEAQGYYLDALNAYMSQYLVGGKKRSNVAMQVESFLRDVLVVPGGIGANIMDIQDFGIPSATRRIPAFNPRFIDEYAADGASVNPPPPPSDITDDDCVICGRAFVWSPLAQAIQLKYYESSDGGEIDLKTQKMMPEDESLSRTTVNIVGRYLFNYQGGALSQYFANTKKPSNKVINLLRLALVPSITVNREMFQLVKDLQFREETPFKFPTAFIDEWQAESWTGNCQRCGEKSNVTTMSWFNTDLLCMDCADKETKHPKFQEAKDRENEEVRKGNLNYEGIGFDAESFSADLTSIKSAETLEDARIAVSNYSSDNTFLNENLTFLASIMDYDYGSGKNSEFEIYGAPTVEDVQKFAESLVNIQRFMGE